MKSPILLGILFPVAVLAIALPLVTSGDRSGAPLPAAASTTGETTTSNPPSAAEAPAAPAAQAPADPTPAQPAAPSEQPETASSGARTAQPQAARPQNTDARYAQQVRGVIDQAASGAYTTDASYAIGVIPQDTPALAEGEHVELVRSNCGVCHSTTHITSQPPLSADTWRSVVYKMKESYGATFISDENADKIAEYLSAHYTPETSPDLAAQDGS